jgi:ABC-type taurine transport system substrate-binding protein
MFEFFAKKLGMDASKVQVVNTAPPGLVGYALADRADAIQLWEPAYTLLKAKKPSIKMLSVVPAGEVVKQIDAVYKAGIDVGYFKSMPSNDTIYVKPMK